MALQDKLSVIAHDFSFEPDSAFVSFGCLDETGHGHGYESKAYANVHGPALSGSVYRAVG